MIVCFGGIVSPKFFARNSFLNFVLFFGLYFAWVSYAEMDKSIFCPQEEKGLGDMPGTKKEKNLSFSFGTDRKLLRKMFWHGLCLIRCMKRNEHHFVRFMTACCDGKEFISKIHFIRDYLRR